MASTIRENGSLALSLSSLTWPAFGASNRPMHLDRPERMCCGYTAPIYLGPSCASADRLSSHTEGGGSGQWHSQASAWRNISRGRSSGSRLPNGQVILTNPFVTNPDSPAKVEAFPKVDVIVVADGHQADAGSSAEIAPATGGMAAPDFEM